MNKILHLSREYRKLNHLELLPHTNNEILEKLFFLYDEKWEEQSQYPYEILTYLFDSYYVLPERPDLASLFCWQAINHSYYMEQLGDNSINFCKDSQGVTLIQRAIYEGIDKYKPILDPYLERLPVKVFHYVASYMLKGYAMENNNIPEKFRASSYNSLKQRIPMLLDIISHSYGKAYCQIANPVQINGEVNLGIDPENKEKSRNIIHSFGEKLKKLLLGEQIEVTFCDPEKTKQQYVFDEQNKLTFVLFGIIYASRCNNFHGNVAARMNSINANVDTFKMYTDIFLLEYIILAIHMNSRGEVSDAVLDMAKDNVKLML